MTLQHLPINIDEQLEEHLNYRSIGFSIIPYTIEYIYDRYDFMPLHWHNELQINWVYEGELDFLINGDSVKVDRGQILFINRKKFHSSRTISQDAKTLCINFDLDFLHPSIVQDYLQPLLEQDNLTYYTLPLTQLFENYLETVLADIPQESSDLVRETESANYLQITNFINLVLENIVLKHSKNTNTVDTNDSHDLNLLLTYIHNNYHEKIKINDLTQQIHMSKTYCNELFQKYTHQSPVQYIMAYRLQTAQELILTTDKSISEIAENCGFSTLSYFVAQFRLKYKLSPLKFRNTFK